MKISFCDIYMRTTETIGIDMKQDTIIEQLPTDK
jgi:hypothetical protein